MSSRSLYCGVNPQRVDYKQQFALVLLKAYFLTLIILYLERIDVLLSRNRRNGQKQHDCGY